MIAEIGDQKARSNFAKKNRRTSLYVFLLRWWSTGAVYFFIAWGTGLGSRANVMDLVFILGVSIALFNSFIINPVLKMLFNYGWHKPYANSTFGQRMVVRGKDCALALSTAILVFWLYRRINMGAIELLNLPKDRVFLPGEPILYGLFFTAISTSIVALFGIIFRKIKKETK